MLAVDPEAVATDLQFPAPVGNAYQLALLLIDRLVAPDARGRRTVGTLSPTALRRAVADVLADHPGWAKGQREGDGPALLAEEAVNLLVSFGLVRRDEDGTVVGLPAVARYRVVSRSPPPLHPASSRSTCDDHGRITRIGLPGHPGRAVDAHPGRPDRPVALLGRDVHLPPGSAAPRDPTVRGSRWPSSCCCPSCSTATPRPAA